MKGKPILNRLLLLTVPLVLFFLSGCATAPTDKGADGEAWAGQMTGRVAGELAMSFSPLEDGEGVHLITGRFAGDIDSGYGGYGSGTVEGIIEGKFKDGIFDLRLSGQARLSEGPAPIHGKMIGTQSQTTAFGTWHMVARSSGDSHRLAGEWRAEKLGAESEADRP